MRVGVIWLVLAAVVAAQVGSGTAATPAAHTSTDQQLIIPKGTKVPVALKHAISTKATREDDAVYAETTFPVVLDGRVLIPAGTYVQGRISRIRHAGRLKGRAEVLMHFTTLIYPSGYTVLLPGAVESAPGIDKTKIKDEEGTIRADSQKAEKIGTVAGTAASGTLVGAAAGGGKGALIGAGIGGAVGTAIGMLTRGNEVKMDAGTTLEMVIQRDIPLDAGRVPKLTRNDSSAQ